MELLEVLFPLFIMGGNVIFFTRGCLSKKSKSFSCCWGFRLTDLRLTFFAADDCNGTIWTTGIPPSSNFIPYRIAAPLSCFIFSAYNPEPKFSRPLIKVLNNSLFCTFNVSQSFFAGGFSNNSTIYAPPERGSANHSIASVTENFRLSLFEC